LAGLVCMQVRLSKLVPSGSIYRGIKNSILPAFYWEPSDVNMRGGVDAAFMSCTADRAVALAFGGDEGLYFDISMGAAGRGCAVSDVGLTYIPGEAEILFPAMSALQVSRQRVEGKKLVLACTVITPPDTSVLD